MADCERNLIRISLYLDGELTTEETAELWQHLETCPLCMSLLDDLTAIRDNLAEGQLAGLPEVPAQLHARIMTAVKAERKKKKPAFAVWKKWGTMAAALALVVISVAYGRTMQLMSGGGADMATATADGAGAREYALAEESMAADASFGDLPAAERAEDNGGKTVESARIDSEDAADRNGQQYAAAATPSEAAPQPEQPVDPGTAAWEDAYRGRLTLTALPSELEAYVPTGYEGEIVLPAELFESAIAQLEELGADYALERPEGYERVEYGLVILLLND